jgi:hypothetical protein
MAKASVEILTKPFCVIECLQNSVIRMEYRMLGIVWNRPKGLFNQMKTFHLRAAGDHSRHKLRLRLANSVWHTSHLVADAMTCWRWRTVPYPGYSPDVAICDFYLFRPIKKGLSISMNHVIRVEADSQAVIGETIAF